ncbi:unnamed protein product [Cunninghamella blakesleeana]
MASPEETFQKGVALRLEGNEAFKRGEYKEALTKYYHAILHLKTVGGQKNKEEYTPRSNEQLVFIYNNMCAVHMKQSNWERVIQYSKKVLELDKENAKAKFRMAQAYLGKKDLDKAEPLLKEIAKISPDDAAVKKELANFEKLTGVSLVKEKQVYRNMMSKMFEEDKPKA